MGKAADWLREERRKVLGDWVAVCLGCGAALRYFEESEDELPADCPQCGGELRAPLPGVRRAVLVRVRGRVRGVRRRATAERAVRREDPKAEPRGSWCPRRASARRAPGRAARFRPRRSRPRSQTSRAARAARSEALRDEHARLRTRPPARRPLQAEGAELAEPEHRHGEDGGFDDRALAVGDREHVLPGHAAPGGDALRQRVRVDVGEPEDDVVVRTTSSATCPVPSRYASWPSIIAASTTIVP